MESCWVELQNTLVNQQQSSSDEKIPIEKLINSLDVGSSASAAFQPLTSTGATLLSFEDILDNIHRQLLVSSNNKHQSSMRLPYLPKTFTALQPIGNQFSQLLKQSTTAIQETRLWQVTGSVEEDVEKLKQEMVQTRLQHLSDHQSLNEHSWLY